jgi:hypothetical protein
LRKNSTPEEEEKGQGAGGREIDSLELLVSRGGGKSDQDFAPQQIAIFVGWVEALRNPTPTSTQMIVVFYLIHVP